VALRKPDIEASDRVDNFYYNEDYTAHALAPPTKALYLNAEKSVWQSSIVSEPTSPG
jgi:hypothetical protein